MARKRRNSFADSTSTTINTKNTIWYIAVYIRLSREDEQEDGENKNSSVSVVNQKKILIEYLKTHFDEQYEIVDFFIDDGRTGTDASRDDFMRMINSIENGKVNCVICKTLARAFRNYADQGYYLEYFFAKNNVRFISTGDPYIDTYINPDAIYGLEVPISGLMNDRYAQKTSADIRRTFDMKRRRGEFIGSFAPYGYLKDPQNKNRLLINPEIASIKRDMFNWIINDSMSLQGVAFKLNELGIPNPTKYKHSLGMKYYNPHNVNNDGLWTGQVVKIILLDKVNLGHMVQGKTKVVSYKVHDKVRVPPENWYVVENTHEPTFSQEEYDKLNEVLKRDTRRPNHSKQVHLFAGFLRCADCNLGMMRSQAGKYVYYVCRTYKSKSKLHCSKHTIREDLLTEAVLVTIQTQIKFVEQLAEIIEKINNKTVINTHSERLCTMLQSHKREREKLQNASDSLYVDWKAGYITQEEHRRLKDRFTQQLQQVDQAISNIEKEQETMNKGVTTDNPLFTYFLENRNIEKLNRPVLVSLVDKIIIHENKEISIQFKYKDELTHMLEYIQMNEGSVNSKASE